MPLHWFQPTHLPKEFRDGFVGNYIGVEVAEEHVDDIAREIQALTGCTHPVYPLGQVIDELGTPHYTFVVHPKDTETFSMARYDSRWRGSFAWAEDELKICRFPAEFSEFIF